LRIGGLLARVEHTVFHFESNHTPILNLKKEINQDFGIIFIGPCTQFSPINNYPHQPMRVPVYSGKITTKKGLPLLSFREGIVVISSYQKPIDSPPFIL
jgi:hypothetical protein